MRSSTLIAGCFALAVKAVIPNDFQQAQGACLEKCHVADVNCQTKCVQMHNPAEDGIDAITACQRNCKPGDGSAEQTSQYGVCLNTCIDGGSLVHIQDDDEVAPAAGSASSGLPVPTSTNSAAGGAPTATATITDGTTSAGPSSGPVTGTSAAASHSHSGSPTPTPSPAGNAAGLVEPGLAGLGLAGLVAAFVV